MIDYDSTPSRYRGTIEVYVGDHDNLTWDVEWRWRCKSRNGQILGHGEGYRRKAGALNAIDAMFASRFLDANGVKFTAVAAMSRTGASDLAILPWRLVIVDRHGNTTTGAVY